MCVRARRNECPATALMRCTSGAPCELLSPREMRQGVVAYQIFTRDYGWWESRSHGHLHRAVALSSSEMRNAPAVGNGASVGSVSSAHKKRQPTSAVCTPDELKVVSDLADTPETLLPVRGAALDPLDFPPPLTLCRSALAGAQEGDRPEMVHAPQALNHYARPLLHSLARWQLRAGDAGSRDSLTCTHFALGQFRTRTETILGPNFM